MMKIQTLHNIDTEYSADSIEWCSHPEYKSYFVCGTYELEGDNSESTSPPCRRKGRIYLFHYNIEDNILRELHRIETAAILDMKWQNLCENNIPVLATANALGQVEIFSLQNEKLKLLATVDLNEHFHNLLTLSLDWSSISSSSSQQQNIVASDSKGDISLLTYADTGLTKLSTWTAHSFEAWICAFDRWDSNRIYTGGDDTFMHVFDIRNCKNVLKITTNKSHLAGVTCLHSHPTKENILLSGSYDENLRIFDIRNCNKPLCDTNLKGGIWRLKSNPKHKDFVLCACMYHNFTVVKLCEELNQITVVAEYNEHTSICYGADWCQQEQQQQQTGSQMIMATCSFYDHKLCISSIVMN